MVFSQKAGVALVHIPKAAGWSVKEYMAHTLPDLHVPDTRDYRGRDWPNMVPDRSLPKGHLRLADWEDVTGIDPAGYKMILGVVRDPFEQAFSQWTYWRHLWREGGRMVQHHVAITWPAFTKWLEDPRGDYHVYYDYHESRPPKAVGETYEDHGGFLRYWLSVGGEVPGNVEIVRMENLDDRLPELLADYGDTDGIEVPRNNEGPGAGEISEHMTDEAREIIERKYPVLTGEDWYGTWGGRMSDDRYVTTTANRKQREVAKMVNVVEGIEDRIWDDGWYHHDGVAFDLREVAGVYYQELDECVHVMFRSGETWRFPDIEDPDPLSHCARLARKGRWDD